MKNHRYVVFDRDGTLIVSHHYLSDPSLVQLLPKTAKALRKLRQLGLGIVIITNQSPINRGIFNEDRLSAIHDRLLRLLHDEGISIDGIYYCPHTPEENCLCRKPQTKLLEMAADELQFNLKNCFVVGDNVCDIEMGKRSRAKTILVRTGCGWEVEKDKLVSPDYTVNDVYDAVQLIEDLLFRKK